MSNETNEKLYALLVERSDGEQIAIIPDKDANSLTSAWSRNPENGEKTWAEIIAADVAQPDEDPWTDSGADLVLGPVAVAVTEADLPHIKRTGRSRALLQKLVRALDKFNNLANIDETTNYATLCDMVKTQEDVERFVVDGRKTRTAKRAESATETVEEPAAEVIEAAVDAQTDAGSHYGFLKDYKHRSVEGVQDFEILEYALQNRDNVLFMGPTQSGKSTAPIAFGEHKSLPVYLLACNVAMEPSQIFGKFIPSTDGGFHWVDGPLTKLVRDGGVLVLDEINVASPKIMTTLYPLLDNRREITLLDHEGEVVKAHKNLLVVATCNLGYQGTLPMSEALLDRFAHRHQWNYSDEVEAQLIKSKSLLKVAQGLRKDGSLRTPFSTSLLKTFERMATSKLGWDYAVSNLLGRFIDPEDHELVRATLAVEEQAIKIELGLAKAPKADPKKKNDAPTTTTDWRDVLSTWA